MRKILMALLCLMILAGLAQAEGIDYASDFSHGTDGWYPRSRAADCAPFFCTVAN